MMPDEGDVPEIFRGLEGRLDLAEAIAKLEEAKDAGTLRHWLIVWVENDADPAEPRTHHTHFEDEIVGLGLAKYAEQSIEAVLGDDRRGGAMTEIPYPAGLEFVEAILAEARQAAREARAPMTIAVSPDEVARLKAYFNVQDARPEPNRIAGVPIQVVDKMAAGILPLPAPRALWLEPAPLRLE